MTALQKSECPAATGHIADQHTHAAILDPAEKTGNSVKRLHTLMARFALRGFAVHEVKDGFLVCRWNLTKHVGSLDDLERFARVVGAT